MDVIVFILVRATHHTRVKFPVFEFEEPHNSDGQGVQPRVSGIVHQRSCPDRMIVTSRTRPIKLAAPKRISVIKSSCGVV